MNEDYKIEYCKMSGRWIDYHQETGNAKIEILALYVVINACLSMLITIFVRFLLRWNSEILNFVTMKYSVMIRGATWHTTFDHFEALPCGCIVSVFWCYWQFSRVTISNYFSLVIIPLTARHNFLRGFWSVQKPCQAVYLF